MTVRKLNLSRRSKPVAEPAPILAEQRKAEQTGDREEEITLPYLLIGETDKAIQITDNVWLPKKHVTFEVCDPEFSVRYRKRNQYGREYVVNAPYIEVTARRWFWEWKGTIKPGARTIYRKGDWRQIRQAINAAAEQVARAEVTA